MTMAWKDGLCDRCECENGLPRFPWRNAESDWTGNQYCSEECAEYDQSEPIKSFEVSGVYDGAEDTIEEYDTWEECDDHARLLAERYADESFDSKADWQVYTQEVWSDGESECSLGQKSDMRPDFCRDDDQSDMLSAIQLKWQTCIHAFTPIGCTGYTCAGCARYQKRNQ